MLPWFPNIPVGIFAAALAVLGAIVSILETKGLKRILWASCFLLLGAGEILVIVKAEASHAAEVEGLKEQLTKIQRQTELNLHTHLEFHAPLQVTGDPLLPFRAGNAPTVAIEYFNNGDQPAVESFMGAGLDVVAHPLSGETEQQTWQKSALHRYVSSSGTLGSHTRGRYITVSAQPLTPEQARGLKRGSLSLCATARATWKDDTGAYCQNSFECLYREPGGNNPPVFNWHLQGWDYNKETRCTYDIAPIQRQQTPE